jgi:hypothetical protein
MKPNVAKSRQMRSGHSIAAAEPMLPAAAAGPTARSAALWANNFYIFFIQDWRNCGHDPK